MKYIYSLVVLLPLTLNAGNIQYLLVQAALITSHNKVARNETYYEYSLENRTIRLVKEQTTSVDGTHLMVAVPDKTDCNGVEISMAYTIYKAASSDIINPDFTTQDISSYKMGDILKRMNIVETFQGNRLDYDAPVVAMAKEYALAIHPRLLKSS